MDANFFTEAIETIRLILRAAFGYEDRGAWRNRRLITPGRYDAPYFDRKRFLTNRKILYGAD